MDSFNFSISWEMHVENDLIDHRMIDDPYERMEEEDEEDLMENHEEQHERYEEDEDYIGSDVEDEALSVDGDYVPPPEMEPEEELGDAMTPPALLRRKQTDDSFPVVPRHSYMPSNPDLLAAAAEAAASLDAYNSGGSVFSQRGEITERPSYSGGSLHEDDVDGLRAYDDFSATSSVIPTSAPRSRRTSILPSHPSVLPKNNLQGGMPVSSHDDFADYGSDEDSHAMGTTIASDTRGYDRAYSFRSMESADSGHGEDVRSRMGSLLSMNSAASNMSHGQPVRENYRSDSSLTGAITHLSVSDSSLVGMNLASESSPRSMDGATLQALLKRQPAGVRVASEHPTYHRPMDTYMNNESVGGRHEEDHLRGMDNGHIEQEEVYFNQEDSNFLTPTEDVAVNAMAEAAAEAVYNQKYQPVQEALSARQNYLDNLNAANEAAATAAATFRVQELNSSSAPRRAPPSPTRPPLTESYPSLRRVTNQAMGSSYIASTNTAPDVAASNPASSSAASRRAKQNRRASYNNSSRRSGNVEEYDNTRMTRLAASQAAAHDEAMDACTFHPKIKNLPASYGPLKEGGTAFVDRMIKWERERHLTRAKKAELAVVAETSECTFTPRINRTSEKAVKFNRGIGPRANAESAPERLFRNHVLAAEHRQRLLEEEARRERRELERDCTFAPKRVTTNAYRHVPSKYADPTVLASEKYREYYNETQNDIQKECTFQPRVKGIAPTMVAAANYASSNVVDRLTRTAEAGSSRGRSRVQSVDVRQSYDDDATSRGGTVIDAATFIGSLLGGAGRGTGNDQGSATRSTSAERQRNFKDFLERQKQSVAKKEEKLQKVTRSITPNFQPRIQRSSSSQRMDAQSTNVPLMDRIEMRTEKWHQKQKRKDEIPDKECTFQPQLVRTASANRLREKASLEADSFSAAVRASTGGQLKGNNAEDLPKGSLRRTRSSFELSRGDQIRQETNRRILSLRVEQERMANATFQPKITARAAQRGYSELRAAQESESYTEWVEAKRQATERARQEELARRAEIELEDCTFVPSTKECPTYVKRIADSLSKLKSVRSSGSLGTEERRDWR